MDGNKLTIKASSLLEVVVSMVIIVVIFGIAMMIYSNVLRYSLSEKQVFARATLLKLINNIEGGTENSTRPFFVGDFRIEEEIKPYLENPSLMEVDLTAYDRNQQKVAEVKKVITTND